MALEEAMLAEDGVLESHLGRVEVSDAEAHPARLMEATCYYVDEEYYGQEQVRFSFYVITVFHFMLQDRMRAFIICYA